MKKLIFLACILITSHTGAAQQAFVKQSLVVNIEVPVRVFDGSTFVDDLTIKDFEIFENGKLQKIEAVYLINKRSIERSNEKKKFNPQTSRNFFLFFEMAEYLPRVGTAIEYFLNNIISPEDNLIIITPLKTYQLKKKALEIKPRKEIIDEIKGIIREDTWQGNSEYRNTLDDITRTAQTISALLSGGRENIPAIIEKNDMDPDVQLDQNLVFYTGLLSRLETLRKVDQMKLLDFAEYLKFKDGQNFVFTFYQREFIPQIDQRILSQYLSLRQDRMDWAMNYLNEFNRRDLSIDIKRIKQAYADASTSIHFLFISKPAAHIPGVTMEEHSEDIFRAFREMAEATGGFISSSYNPVSAFKEALDAAEHYYLLYYSPKDYSEEGEFKNIEVRIKNKGFKILHRTGYFAY